VAAIAVAVSCIQLYLQANHQKKDSDFAAQAKLEELEKRAHLLRRIHKTSDGRSSASMGGKQISVVR
jgi:hypothetical protein